MRWGGWRSGIEAAHHVGVKPVPIQVECYAGGRADEKPRRIRISGREHVVERLLSSSLELTPPASRPFRRFRVLTEDGLELDLLCDPDGEWFLDGVHTAEAQFQGRKS